MNDAPEPQSDEELKQQIEEVEATFQRHTTKSIIFWGIRWTIGFTIIWFVVNNYPDMYWLWWAGIIIAALSLVLMLAGEWLVSKRLDKLK